MSVITRQIGQCFAAEVEGVDMAKPLSAGRGGRDPRRHGPVRRAGVPRPGRRRRAAAGLHAAAWATSSTPSAPACARPTSTGCRPRSPTCPTWTRTTRCSRATTAGGCSRSATGCGTPTARSRSSPAKYSLLRARSVPSKGGNTEFADMRAAYDALDARDQGRSRTSICEHSQIFSRQQLGFTDFTEEERERFEPVRQRLVRTHPSTGRKSLYLSSHAGAHRRLAGAGGAALPARPHRARHAAAVRLRPQVAGWRPRHVGQPPDHAPRPALPGPRAARRAPHHARWAKGRLFDVGGPERAPHTPHAPRPGGAVALRGRRSARGSCPGRAVLLHERQSAGAS